MKKVLITGAHGFIGRNLIEKIGKKYLIFNYDKNNTIEELENFIIDSEVIVHLAGSNRPLDFIEYNEVNFGLTQIITNFIKKHSLKTPIIFSSSIQATLNNPYGESKKKAEDLLIQFSKENNCNVFILRLTNVFGKWCKPNYNSVVATFCYNIAKDLQININDSNALLKLIFIDDVTNKIIELINFVGEYRSENIIELETYHEVRLGELAELIYSFKNNSVIDFSDKDFVNKLKRTYEAYETEFKK